MSVFKELFEKYGFTVEPFGINSFIADNGIFCVPFTEHTFNTKYGNHHDISAVSFLSVDKDDIKEYYKQRGTHYIGCDVFDDYMNNKLKFIHIGCICNHDHCLFEVEDWLKKLNKN